MVVIDVQIPTITIPLPLIPIRQEASKLTLIINPLGHIDIVEPKVCRHVNLIPQPPQAHQLRVLVSKLLVVTADHLWLKDTGVLTNRLDLLNTNSRISMANLLSIPKTRETLIADLNKPTNKVLPPHYHNLH